MEDNRPRASLSPEGQVEATTQQVRRSSLNFFRRISGSDIKTTSSSTQPTRAPSQSQPQSRSKPTMLFKSLTKDVISRLESAKLEVAPSDQPRIPSFHFDAMTNLAFSPRRDGASSSPSSSLPPHHISHRNRLDMLGKSYRSQHTPNMPPIPQIPITPPAQDSYDPFARSSTMTSSMTTSITNRGRYGYSASNITIPDANSPHRLRRKKDATPFK